MTPFLPADIAEFYREFICLRSGVCGATYRPVKTLVILKDGRRYIGMPPGDWMRDDKARYENEKIIHG